MDPPGPSVPMGPPGAGPPPMAPPMNDGFNDPNRASIAPSMGPYPVGPGIEQPVYGWRRFIGPGMAGLGAITSFIGLVVEIVVLAQGVQAYLNKDQTNKASDTKTKTKTVTPDNDLLGRRALLTYLVKRQKDTDRQPADAIVQYYVPNTDIPTRAGAVGFNAVAHVLVALAFAVALWVQWKLYRRQPPAILGDGRWAATCIAAFQCIVAFDLLGRNISPLAQAGAYLLFIFSLPNLIYSVQAAINAPPAPQPFRDSMYDPEMQAPTMQGDLPLPEDGMGDGMDEKLPEDAQEQLADPAAEKRPGRHRSRTVSTVVSSSAASAYSQGTGGPDDVESYYLRSPTLRGAPRPPARVAFADSARQQHQQRLSPIPASSPVTLYGPLEQQRRVEQVRRSRRMSLTAPAAGEMQQHQQAGNGFHMRSMDPATNAIPEDEEENTAVMALPNHRVSRDGFAHRAQEWKKLQRMT